jgi:hypothetical protein
VVVGGPVSIAGVRVVAHQAERTKAIAAGVVRISGAILRRRAVSLSGVKVVGRPVRIPGIAWFRARTAARGVAIRAQSQPGREGIRQVGLRVGDLGV